MSSLANSRHAARWRVVAASAAWVGLTGCLPVAWVTPPTRVDVGFGPVARARDAELAPARPRTHVALDVKGSVAPLQLVPGLSPVRYVDIDAGYGMRVTSSSRRLTHGPFFGVYGMLPIKDNMRASLGGQLHALTSSDEGGYGIVGNRAVGRLGLEWTGWADRTYHACAWDGDGGFCGTTKAYGEGAVGFYMDVSQSRGRGASDLGVMFGISARIPVTMGAGIVLIPPETCLGALF